jgi:hypothetical protein
MVLWKSRHDIVLGFFWVNLFVEREGPHQGQPLQSESRKKTVGADHLGDLKAKALHGFFHHKKPMSMLLRDRLSLARGLTFVYQY